MNSNISILLVLSMQCILSLDFDVLKSKQKQPPLFAQLYVETHAKTGVHICIKRSQLRGEEMCLYGIAPILKQRPNMVSSFIPGAVNTWLKVLTRRYCV